MRSVAQQRPVSAVGALRSPTDNNSVNSSGKVVVNKRRTPHSRQSAPPVVDTPVVIVRKASPSKQSKQNNKNPLEIGGIRKEIGEKSPRQTPNRTRPAPMRYKYDAPPGFNDAYGKQVG